MTVNLLPPKIKQDKAKEHLARITGTVMFLILAIIIVSTGGIYSANFFAQKDLKSMKNKVSEQNQLLLRYKKTEDGINTINQKLKKIDSVNSQKIFWSDLLNELAKSTPIQIQIKTLSMSQDNKKLNLTGFAETRNDIAKFKEKLEKSQYFTNVTFTSSVHNETQSNYSFNISCDINKPTK